MTATPIAASELVEQRRIRSEIHSAALQDRTLSGLEGRRHPCLLQGYDLDRGVMLATEAESGRKLEVSVQASSKIPLPEKGQWGGNRVDAAMAKALGPGDRVVLEGARVSDAPVSRDDDRLPAVAKWVVQLPNPGLKNRTGGL